jgi:hypothetical protein
MSQRTPQTIKYRGQRYKRADGPSSVFVKESLKRAVGATKQAFELFKLAEQDPMVKVHIQSAIALLTGALRGHP